MRTTSNPKGTKVYCQWNEPSITADPAITTVRYLNISDDFSPIEEKPTPINTAKSYGMTLNKRRGRP